MITSYLNLSSWYRWAIRFIQLQLFVTTLSLPILISWGLPISLLTFAGNLFFGPLLTAFLFLTSLMFFTELLYIPNSYIAWPLEQITYWWVAGMNLADHRFLIGFAQPPLWFLIAVPTAACIIIQHRYTASLKRSIIGLSLLLFFSCAYIQFISSPTELTAEIPCNGGSVHIIRSNNQTLVIDPGVIGKKISAPSWMEYTLMPELIKLTGSTTIDHFIALQPGNMIFQAITTLCKKISVRAVYIPYFEGTLSKNGWRSFFELKRYLNDHDIEFIRLSTKPLSIPLGENDFLSISHLETTISHGDLSYPAFHAYREAKHFSVKSSKLIKKQLNY